MNALLRVGGRWHEPKYSPAESAFISASSTKQAELNDGVRDRHFQNSLVDSENFDFESFARSIHIDQNYVSFHGVLLQNASERSIRFSAVVIDGQRAMALDFQLETVNSNLSLKGAVLIRGVEFGQPRESDGVGNDHRAIGGDGRGENSQGKRRDGRAVVSDD